MSEDWVWRWALRSAGLALLLAWCSSLDRPRIGPGDLWRAIEGGPEQSGKAAPDGQDV
jgi:hypothetical protein